MNKRLRQAIEHLADKHPELLAKEQAVRIYLLTAAQNYAKKYFFDDWDACHRCIDMLVSEFCTNTP